MEIKIDEKKVIMMMVALLLGSELFLVLLDGIVNYGRLTEIGALRRLSNIAREDGLGTFFAASQTLFAGLTALLAYMFSKKIGKPLVETLGWLITGVFFVYMAVDDASQIHERMGTTFEIIAERNEQGILNSILHLSPSYPWQLIFVPIFGSIGLYMTYFLWRELGNGSMRMLLIFALSFMAIAVGLDFIEGLEKEHPWNIYTYLIDYLDVERYTVRHFAKVLEEFLEMLSITTFWIVFVKHLISLLNSHGLKVKKSEVVM